jgi:hypothetical protein
MRLSSFKQLVKENAAKNTANVATVMRLNKEGWSA